MRLLQARPELLSGGILAILLANPEQTVSQEICEGLNLLQHRGQDACGIVTSGQKGRLFQTKSNGMVRDVLDERALGSLMGNMGVGHGPCLVLTVLLEGSSLCFSAISNCRI
jgi:glutamine phosphoribosylpyrophosphate amidotransferase